MRPISRRHCTCTSAGTTAAPSPPPRLASAPARALVSRPILGCHRKNASLEALAGPIRWLRSGRARSCRCSRPHSACARDVTTLDAPVRRALWPLSEPPQTRACPAIVVDPRLHRTLARTKPTCCAPLVAGDRPDPGACRPDPSDFWRLCALSHSSPAAARQAHPSVRRPRTLTPDWSLPDERPAVVAGALAIVAAVLTSVTEPGPGAAGLDPRAGA